MVLDGLGEAGALGAVLDGDALAPQILVRLHVVVGLEDRHLHARLEVRVGEVEHLLAGVGDGHARDDAVRLPGLHGLKGRVEAELLDVDLEALVLGDRIEQVDVDADEFAVFVLEFERGECQIGGDRVGAAGLRARDSGGEQRCDQRQQDGQDRPPGITWSVESSSHYRPAFFCRARDRRTALNQTRTYCAQS